jgi:hypothetical protein
MENPYDAALCGIENLLSLKSKAQNFFAREEINFFPFSFLWSAIDINQLQSFRLWAFGYKPERLALNLNIKGSTIKR